MYNMNYRMRIKIHTHVTSLSSNDSNALNIMPPDSGLGYGLNFNNGLGGSRLGMNLVDLIWNQKL
ncbi:uncharacterized protein G2W53_022436 [Senna tora]|uniref:Uncharacterized protein n=1 Tax=Senna tora TaxID=362788 RepID=A0A834TM90_9FABA|nr:uncharacterized protein G2W53_022436 [Senna tora]